MTLLSLILPVHNEEEVITSVFTKIYNTLKKNDIEFEIILVENGSSDNSLKVLTSLSKKYKYTKTAIAPKGYFSAIKKGASVSKGKYICYMPSDGQSDETKIKKLLEIILKENYDIVKVKRVTRENLIRYFVSRSFSLTMFFIFRTKLIDVNGSPRIILRKNFNLLEIKSNDSFGDAEMLIKASLLNWKIKEIPMENINRIGGKSTRSVKTFTEFFGNIYNYRFGKIIQEWKKKHL